MVKKIFVFLLILFSVRVYARSLEQAEKEAIAKRDAILEKEICKIDSLFREIGKDGVIGRKEMSIFLNSLISFENLKDRLDRELRIYGEETTIELRSDYWKILKEYKMKHRVWLRDSQGKVRKIFAEVVGKDVEVKGTVCFSYLFLSIFCLIWGCLLLAGGIKTKRKLETLTAFIFFLSGLVLLLK